MLWHKVLPLKKIFWFDVVGKTRYSWPLLRLSRSPLDVSFGLLPRFPVSLRLSVTPSYPFPLFLSVSFPNQWFLSWRTHIRSSKYFVRRVERYSRENEFDWLYTRSIGLSLLPWLQLVRRVTPLESVYEKQYTDPRPVIYKKFCSYILTTYMELNFYNKKRDIYPV